MTIHFTIVTPSMNQLDYLKRCIASVRDQVAAPFGAGVDECLLMSDGEESGQATRRIQSSSISNHQSSTKIALHHHIQDGGSTDGTVEFLEELCGNDECSLIVDGGKGRGGGERRTANFEHRTSNGERRTSSIQRPATGHQQPASSSYRLSFSSEPDKGMYDALNKGMERGGGEVDECSLMNGRKEGEGEVDNSHQFFLAWLNCDEQYLPGALARVAEAAVRNPEAALFSGGALLVDPEGRLVAFRKSYPLRRAYIQVDHLYNLSCGLFFRDSSWREIGGFDDSLRDAADMDLVVRLLQRGYRSLCLPGYTAAFFMTGRNMSSGENAAREYRLLHRRAPAWMRALRGPLRWARRGEKWLRGVYREDWPLEYALYLGDELEQRRRVRAESGSPRWPVGVGRVEGL